MNETLDVLIPQENVNDDAARVIAWLVPSGAQVAADQPLVELETSKTNFEIRAPREGFVHYSIEAGAEVPVGSIICRISAAAHETEPVSVATEPTPSGNGQKIAEHLPAETKVASRLSNQEAAAPTLEAEQSPVSGSAKELLVPQSTRFTKNALAAIASRGLDLSTFSGRGLVREVDVLRAAGVMPQSIAPSPASGGDGAAKRRSPRVVPAAGVPVEIQPLSRGKQNEIKYLAAGSAATLTSTIVVACPTRGLRAAVASVEQTGGSLLPIIIYETARLLRKYPLLNAFYEDGNANLYQEVNVGFAIDIERGLKVPVVRDADKKTIPAIAQEVLSLTQAYLGDSLPPQALASGTFTITDLSGQGVSVFQPLINRGQSAILGIGAEIFPAGVFEGSFNLILAFDHQLAEGLLAAKFAGELAGHLKWYGQAVNGNNPAAPAQACSRCGATLETLDRRHRFLVPIIQHDGSRGLLCPRCFDGW